MHDLATALQSDQPNWLQTLTLTLHTLFSPILAALQIGSCILLPGPTVTSSFPFSFSPPSQDIFHWS